MATEDVEVQRVLTALHGKLRAAEGEWAALQQAKAAVAAERGFVDKYRVEMLHDARKVSGQVESQMTVNTGNPRNP